MFWKTMGERQGFFFNSSFLSFSSLIATKQSSTAPSSSPPPMATAQCCCCSQQEQLSSGPQAVSGSRYCDADAVPLELTAVRHDPMEKANRRHVRRPPSKESPTQRPIHRFVAVLFGYRTPIGLDLEAITTYNKLHEICRETASPSRIAHRIHRRAFFLSFFLFSGRRGRRGEARQKGRRATHRPRRRHLSLALLLPI